MNDPHVVALFYNIEHKQSVVYRDAAPRAYEAANFSVRIKNNKVRFPMKAHYATAAAAKAAVRAYIENWEFTAGLRGGPDLFKLVYQKAQLEDRTAASGHHRIDAGRVSWQFAVSEPTIPLTTSYPSPPPSGMKITPDVQSMSDRFAGYRLGKEPLASMASFCLTVLEISTGASRRRHAAAVQYGIDRAVLDQIGNLSSEKGDTPARKAAGLGRPLTPSDTRFLEEAITALILRAAAVAHAPHARRAAITLTDLPKC